MWSPVCELGEKENNVMKIKTKKQMNLPQLIEWGFENNVRNECFLTHDSEGNTSEVHFDIRGLPKFSSMVDMSDTFIVEVEEEITEDTVLHKVIELYSNENKNIFAMQHCDRTIKQIQDEGGCKSLAFYILNDNFTMTLIWTREKGLVE